MMMIKLCTAVLFGLAASTIVSAQTEFPKPEGLAPGTGYSHVVVTSPGKLVFIAGQVARDAKGNLVGKDDLKAQTDQVFANLKAALASTGATFNDVVKINWYVKSYKAEYLPVLREVRDRYINKTNPPASTLIGVAALANDDYLLEVEAVAALPNKAAKKK
ncbi:MAG TPA: RidA family protein [Candidatus Angelobacter sp.]|jgi:enamine deaminase RidA (YjgF/YER057c/UK114 family)|nr:RidA family protein [Candidatus Angelobacter sp.]